MTGGFDRQPVLTFHGNVSGRLVRRPELTRIGRVVGLEPLDDEGAQVSGLGATS